MSYAAGSEVSVDKSRTELERTIQRFGASTFMYGWTERAAMIGFEVRNRQIRLTLPLPDEGGSAFTRTPTGLKRTDIQARQEYEKEVRRRWRALNLVVKAKLTAIDDGISSFEDEFLSYFVMPTGQTVGDAISSQLGRALDTGNLPPLLPAPREGR